MPERSKKEQYALAAIEKMHDPEQWRNMIANARKQNSEKEQHAAFSKLCEVRPSAEPGTVEHDVWRSIHALEEMLRPERGKTVLLSRTRQKIARDGEVKTVADLTNKSHPSDGFRDLVRRGYTELTFEAVLLRHPLRFDEATREAARVRLAQAAE